MRVLVLLVVALGCWTVSPNARGVPDRLALGVWIHDYAHVPAGSVRHAEQVVADIYGRIGVRTDWHASVRPDEAPVSKLRRWSATEFVVIVLNSVMARDHPVADDVLGMAPVDPIAGGHIAYVLFDRVCDAAAETETDSMEAMGVVIAHELAHLLLPYESHSVTGLMRRRFMPSDLIKNRLSGPTFTRAQAVAIRQTIERSATPASR